MRDAIARMHRHCLLSTMLLGACSRGPQPQVRAVSPLSAEQMAGRFHRFVDAQRLVLLVYGDAGKDNADQDKVGRAMAKVCARRQCSFAISLGDNIYNAGVDGLWDDDFIEKFEEPYAQLGDIKTWLVLGNHDWLGDVQAQIDYTLRSKRWLMPDVGYAIPGLPSWVSIVGYDSQTVRDASPLAERQRRVVEEGLCGRPGWHLLFAHHPAVSSGKHGDDPTIRDFVEHTDQRCGIDVYLAGHDHHQEHQPTPRFHQIVQGAAASERPVRANPNASFVASEEGFAVIDLTPAVMQVAFYDDDGVGRLIYHTSVTRL